MCHYPLNSSSSYKPTPNLWSNIDNSIILNDILAYFQTITGLTILDNQKVLLTDCSKIDLTIKKNLFIEQILYWVLKEAERKISKREYTSLEIFYEKCKQEEIWEYERKNQFYHFFEELKALNIRIFLLFRDFNSLSKYIDQSDFQRLYNLTLSNNLIHVFINSLIPLSDIPILGDFDRLFYSTFKLSNIHQQYSPEEFERFYDIMQKDCLYAMLYENEHVNHKQIKELILNQISYIPLELDHFKFELLNSIRNSKGIHYEEAINKIFKIKNQKMKTIESFISYAWGDELEETESREIIVDLIDSAFKKNGICLIRDKNDLNYKDNIREFEERIANGMFIIIVISDKYLKSVHCMHELLLIYNKGRIHQRIFPIVLKDALIYDDIKRLEYVEYWYNKHKELNNRKNEIPDNTGTVETDKIINLYSDIHRYCDEITSMIKNMNNLTPEKHIESDFSQIIEVILSQIETGKSNFEQKDKPIDTNVININQSGINPVFIYKNDGNITIN